MKTSPRIVLALLASVAIVRAQAPDPSLRFYKVDGSGRISLADDTGNVVHTWPAPARGAVDIAADGSMLTVVSDGAGTGVQRLAFDGTLVWDYRVDPQYTVHHDLEALPNGNVLLIAEEVRSAAQAIAAGRDPSLLPRQTMEFDSILEVQPTGPTSGIVVWEWHVWDHLIQDFDGSRPNFGVVADHPELADLNYPPTLVGGVEFNHMNGLDYDPIHDRIILSSPAHNEVWVIDHGTTTAEARGHVGGRWGRGGDLLYRWGNPAAYDRGTAAAQQLDFQHAPRFVPPGYPGAGNVTIFSNRTTATRSTVLEIVLPLDAAGAFQLGAGAPYGPAAPVWTYSSPGFFSRTRSSAERLPNGNTLICSAVQQRLFEVTPAGQIVWEVPTSSTVFHAHHTRRSLWIDATSRSASTGGVTTFHLEGGSSRAGDRYLLLGSGSGTSPGFTIDGVAVPLNPDGYLFAALGSAGTGAFASWFGSFDAGGSATANLALPPLPALAGLRLDHAFVSLSGPLLVPEFASNAVPLTFF